MIAGKFKGKQDTEVIDAKELRELLASGDHDSVVSSEGLVMSDGDLEALLDRSDLQFKASARKKSKQPSNQTNTVRIFPCCGGYSRFLMPVVFL